MTRVHIVGAGMAGLAAAVASIKAGRKVVVHEAAGHAGGRCRSFHDSRLERSIDNGNHLMLGANRALFDYLDDIGAPGGLVGQERAALPFVDIRSDERWTLRPNRGRLPWWIMSAARRVPKSRARDYLAALRLAWASPEATVIDCLGNASGRLYERLWKPLTDAVLNTDPHDGAARLLWPVVYATFGRGEAASPSPSSPETVAKSVSGGACARSSARAAACDPSPSPTTMSPSAPATPRSSRSPLGTSVPCCPIWRSRRAPARSSTAITGSIAG
jgi:phytoene dehydrogenase-like protein